MVKPVMTHDKMRDTMAKLTIVVDTREQVNFSVLEWLTCNRVPRTSRKLDVGDYSFQLGEDSYEDELAIERKGSLDELAMNVSTDRARFEAEMLRAKSKGTQLYLIVENCAGWTDIIEHNYKSKLSPQSFRGTLLAWQDKYNFKLHFCRQQDSGSLIYGICYYYLKNRLGA